MSEIRSAAQSPAAAGGDPSGAPPASPDHAADRTSTPRTSSSDPAAAPRAGSSDPAAAPRSSSSDPASAPRSSSPDPASAPRAGESAAADRASSPAADEWLDAGGVGRPHGLDGSFHVTRPRVPLLESGRTLVIDGRSFEIVRRAGTDARPIVRLADCTTRADAEALRGRELLVARADAPPLEEDEWWPEELVGCRVDDGGTEIGVVRSLRALPSCDILEVARSDRDDLLVPLIRDAVRVVDVEARRIEIDLEFLGETAD